jgi:hypothetical protein
MQLISNTITLYIIGYFICYYFVHKFLNENQEEIYKYPIINTLGVVPSSIIFALTSWGGLFFLTRAWIKAFFSILITAFAIRKVRIRMIKRLKKSGIWYTMSKEEKSLILKLRIWI